MKTQNICFPQLLRANLRPLNATHLPDYMSNKSDEII